MHTRYFGASWAAVSGRRAKRCEIASQHGASVVYDLAAPDSVDVAAEVIKATGRGVDVVIDCAGAQASMDTSLQAVRPGGMIMNVASWSVRPTIDMNLMIGKEAILASASTRPYSIHGMLMGCASLHRQHCVLERSPGHPPSDG